MGTEQAPSPTVSLEIPVSPGELLDKISILEIKQSHIEDERKQKNVGRELDLLLTVRKTHIQEDPALNELVRQLKSVNLQLWEVEDDIRAKEFQQKFDDEFIQLARSVYQLNDERAALKKNINLLLGSDIVEEKSYHPV